MNLALYAIMVLLFASWTTIHVLLCARILVRDWRRAAAALVVFPLAPYFGHSLEVKKLPLLWVVCALSYSFSLLAGSI